MDFTGLNGEPHGSGTYLQKSRCFGEVHPTIRLLIFRPETWSLMMTSQRCYTLLCPAIAAAGLIAVAIEDASDQFIVADVGEQRNCFDQRLVVPAATPRNSHFSV